MKFRGMLESGNYSIVFIMANVLCKLQIGK